jgi:hypothetical protein
MIANAYAGPGQELAPLLHRDDVVRWVPRRGACRYRYVRVTADFERRARTGRGPEWVTFYGAPVRAYDWGVRLGPERAWDVKVAGLRRMPRRPVRFATRDGLVVDVISLGRSGPWYRIRQRPRDGSGLIMLAEVRTPDEVDQVLRRVSLGRACLADLEEVGGSQLRPAVGVPG